jgi:hypothetical protein
MHVTLARSDQNSHFYTVEDRRDWVTTCYHRALACFRHLLYGGAHVRRMCYPIRPLQEATVSLETGRYVLATLPWNDKSCQSSNGLCLFLHGLNASPRQWETYSRKFPSEFPNTHYLVGVVFKAGNCSLKNAGDPFVEVIEDYVQKFPGKPIVLIGTSNGGRLASYIETKINPRLLSQGSQLRVFSIAGVHGGTKLMNLAHQIGCARILRHHPDVTKELSFNSEESSRLVKALQQRQSVWKTQGVDVFHYFYAATEDEKVRPLASSFPYLGTEPRTYYEVIYGETHETIVDRVQERIFFILKGKRE